MLSVFVLNFDARPEPDDPMIVLLRDDMRRAELQLNRLNSPLDEREVNPVRVRFGRIAERADFTLLLNTFKQTTSLNGEPVKLVLKLSLAVSS
jgi:hypothetical protein